MSNLPIDKNLYIYHFEDGSIGVSGVPPLEDDRKLMADGCLSVFKVFVVNGGPAICELEESSEEIAMLDVFPDETNSYHEPQAKRLKQENDAIAEALAISSDCEGTLRAACESIVVRASGGTGAAVVDDVTTLAKIAEQALSDVQ